MKINRTHAKRRRVERCSIDKCVDIKGTLKNKDEVLEEQVKKERGTVEVYEKLNMSLKESSGIAALDLVESKSQI